MKSKTAIKILALYALIGKAAANSAATIIAGVICGLIPDLMSLARLIAILIFVYGGAKYAFSADDPGGRKQGKTLAIHALVGFIIVAASEAIVEAISGTQACT